ncbi:RluA family pseudouridine synthase [Candidatus Thioglobus sp. NP1]|uniref:RluA family pseudouridine synthase n=1 Tax=Candidatus Thioglobus sp. NP1 TaxID=2508687 RepID=UPI000DED5DB2|nr:RluA family pseudouridine synthase [Candidatus Thioglobus sp. NP1]AXE61488.1 23S rRNA pseudouridine(955/2504/2580) synthase [Candidatus Thioglobus sp. NP1]
MPIHDAPRLITVDEFSIGQRLDNYLVKQLKGVPKSHIYRIIRKGEVRVNKGRKKADYRLISEDIIRIPPIRTSITVAVKPSDNLLETLNNSILFEDKGLLIINKPHGMAVHGGSGVTIGIIEALKSEYKEPIELVHRLDRATSGCLILAKKRSVLKALHEQLFNHQLEKRYIALVKNSWSKKRHTVDAPIYQNSRNSVIDSKGKESLSHFHPLKNFQIDDYSASLVDVVIETGRTHQIRVHAKYAEHPLAQDNKYGDPNFDKLMKKKGLNRLFLHAKAITFTNPMTNEIQKISAPLPDDLEKFLAKL